MNNYQVILGIETSCDETAAAVLRKDGDQIRVLSNVVASSAKMQAEFGGIIPEQAAREQLKAIIPVVETALLQAMELSSYQAIKLASFREKKDKASISKLLKSFVADEIDAIAVTYGPGLIGSLLIGVETAKTLALTWLKPLIPVNHLLGHFYANWIAEESRVKSQESSRNEIASGGDSDVHWTSSPRNDVAQEFSPPSFPCIGLLVSGGHTDLVLFEDHLKYKYLGGTRDDAAGECFDKCARLMGLPYPGGPQISKLAKLGDASKIKLPKPMSSSGDFDFSFSGLKTAVANSYKDIEQLSNGAEKDKFRADLAAAVETTIIDVLIKKTIGAADKYGILQIMVAGGVAANENLSAGLRRFPHVIVRNPQKIFCTDNGAMIAAAGFFTDAAINPLSLQANPNLSL